MRRAIGSILLLSMIAMGCGGGGGGGGGNGGGPPPPITTLYVRRSGNDDNTGTSPDTALATVARAAQLLAAGVVVYVGPGTYKGAVDIVGVRTTKDHPAALVADPTGAQTGDAPGEVVIDGNRNAFAVRVSNSPFVTVDGFTITGATGDKSTLVQVRGTSDHFDIRNCTLRDGGAAADGIRIQGSDDALIFNNLVVGNNRGIRIADGAQRARVFNNTVVNNLGSGISIGGADGNQVASTDASVRNNIVQNSRNHLSIQVQDDPPSSRPGYGGNYNLAFAADLADQKKTYQPTVIRGDKDVNADAQFVDDGNGDFHLAAGSPAINAGTGMLDAGLLKILTERSTTSDGMPDKTPVDLGYHFPAGR
jgi:parallel beta-helix repeat protein